MKEAGILGVGQDLLPEDTNDGLIYFQRMIAQFQRRRWLVPSLTDIATVGNGLISNPIGKGQFWNYPRPDKIQGGYVIQYASSGGLPISFPLYPIFSYEDYIQLTIKNLPSLPDHFFYDAQNPVGNVFIWPIPSNQYEIHLLLKSQIGLSTTIKAGVISSAGQLYTNGVYFAVPLAPQTPVNPAKQFVSFGTGATANITVAGGIVTTVAIQNGGEDFKVNDLLTCAAANIGGTGNGFTFTVTDTLSNLDSDIDMPEEMLEAIHYSLALRLCSAYQIEVQESTKSLARAAMSTIRMANTQVPQLAMPPTLRQGKAFNLYNADGY